MALIGPARLGRGEGGRGRGGRPRTNAERRARHRKRFGTSKLPPRGTGLRRIGG